MKRSRTLAAVALTLFISLSAAPAAVAAPWYDQYDGAISRVFKFLKRTLWIGDNSEKIGIPPG